MSVKPHIGEDSCRRLGKEQTSTGRRLLVRLGSEDAATHLLRAAPQLRQSDVKYIAQNVYINADLSSAAAKLAFEARQLRRASKQQQTYRHDVQRSHPLGPPTHHSNQATSSSNGVGISGAVPYAAVIADTRNEAEQGGTDADDSEPRVTVKLNPSASPFQRS